ncbi:CLUMA_CG000005, isoform A [Clunio marinus]|uniref:CLUMA_CG000005, isoform A n=1 Tax=Clunio marinus TaxID=568069 RepID=A0A1J1HE08_9DIPT|nr:CLUMA_CG000005, isoform A [Clunio marinus]
METLRGIFPVTQPPPKRDFLRENVMRIKHIQRTRNSGKETEYLNKFSKPIKCRKFSSNDNNSRSTNSLVAYPSKSTVNNLRRAMSTMFIQDQKEIGVQTVDTNDEYFLKDSIIRFPSASSIRSGKARPTSSCQRTQIGSRDNLDTAESLPKSRLTNHSNRNEIVNNYISSLDEYPGKQSVSKRNPPVSILKNSSSTSIQKSNKNYINESQRKEKITEKHKNECAQLIDISDEEDFSQEKDSLAEKEISANDATKETTKTAEMDPDCPEGHVALSDSERLETLKVAKKRFKELVDELNRLPMTCETLRVRNRKIAIEKELRTLETNMRVFSRTKVYVKLETNN